MKLSRILRQGLTALALAGMATMSGGPTAEAATEVGNLTVTADVLASCTVAGGSLAFVGYSPAVTHTAGVPLDATGSFDYQCVVGINPTIRLSQGANPAGTSTAAVPDRRMVQGADFLSYNLYTGDPATPSPLWGDTTGTGVVTVSTGAVQNVPVWGRIPGGQVVSSGAGYTDTVVISLDF